MKLRTKIFLVFSLLTITLLTLFTWFAYSRYEATIQQRIESVTDALFDNAVITANKTLDRLQGTLNLFNFYYNDGTTFIQNLADFSDPDNPPDIYDSYVCNKQFQRSCQNTMFVNDFIYGIYVITPSGYIFSYTNNMNGTIMTDEDYTDTSWYTDTMELNGNMYISMIDNHSLFSGSKRSVFFAKKLTDVYTHRLLGIMVVDCKPQIFDLSTANTMPDITLLTIENTDTCDILYTNYDDVNASFSEDNRKVMTQELNLSPLKLVAVIDYESLHREYNVTGQMMLFLSFVCIILTLVLSYFFARSITLPVEHLSRKMAAQTGHTLTLSGRYLDRTDEIGTLYNEYNAMVESLNTAVKQDYHNKLVNLDAQMKSLEARINSHFLFNTLESINSMAELEDNELIATMSQSLGNMFRYTLKTQSELVSVQNELDHVQDYVTIQRIRFDNRFHLETIMEDSFRREQVLKLILQPLVENALYHGLRYCTCGDTITIYGRKEGNYLILHVRDNGMGMNQQQLRILQERLMEEASFTELGQRNKQSIGLKNIHSRIELYYGRGYGLTVTSEEGKYTDVQIKLPVLKREE